VSNKSKKRAAQKQSVSSASLLVVLGGLVLIGAAILLIVSANSAPPAAVEVSGAPSLKVDREKVDLGTVKLGQTVSVSFELTNVGDRPLRFTGKPYIQVAAGC